MVGGRANNYMKRVAEEIEELEHQMRESGEKSVEKIRTLQAKVEEEVLQTRTVPLEEVRAELESWVPAFQEEYENLTNGPVSPISDEEFRLLKASGQKMEILPMKAVATRKPPNKRKGRVVVCGNYSSQQVGEDVSVGGVCSTAIRAAVHLATNKRWQLGTIDITGAFLQAPRRSRDCTTIVEPPHLLQQMNITRPGERWKVACALYGFIESPADWAHHRDQGLRTMTWSYKGEELRICETPERHVWKILNPEGEFKGVVLVYVDDFLVGGDQGVLDSFFKTIKERWICSGEEMIEEKATRFCGYELQKRKEGHVFWLGQTGYLDDLLKKRGVVEKETTPCPRVEEAEDELSPNPAMIKEAQMLVGETMWLSCRTRPDIAYTTGLISRLLHRRPSSAVAIARHLLKYLFATRDLRLEYKTVEEHQKEEGVVPVDLRKLNVFADVSFALPHEQWRSIQGILLESGGNWLMWTSTRQPFVAQSTAEGELLSYNEAFIEAESIASMLEMLELPTTRCLYGDNQAAITLCKCENGAWRTRHLRLRAAKLREMVQGESSLWEAHHLRGCWLPADELTKALMGQSFVNFVSLLRMKKSEAGDVKPAVKSLQGVDQESSSSPRWSILLGAVGSLLSLGQCVVASSILACVILSQGGRTKDRKKIEKTAQEPVKVGGPDKPREEDRSGTVTPVVFKLGLTGMASFGDFGKQAVDSVVRDDIAPSLRALRFHERKEGSDSSGSHGSSSHQSGAKARGVAAINSMGERQASSSTDKTSVVVDVDSLAGAFEMNFRVGPIASSADGGQSSHVSEAQQSVHGYGQPQPSGQLGGKMFEKKVIEHEMETKPWELSAYQSIRSSSTDALDLDHWKEGWVCRRHHKERKRPFHPVHRSTPVNTKLLEPSRVTLRFSSTKEREVIFDEWTAPRMSKGQDDQCWRGYTFFRAKKEEAGTSSQPSGHDTPPSDYEFVDDEF